MAAQDSRCARDGTARQGRPQRTQGSRRSRERDDEAIRPRRGGDCRAPRAADSIRHPRFSNSNSSQRRKQMTTTTQTQAGPDGTWAADKVHSTVWFAVNYLAGTFQGSFADVDAD